MSPSSKDPKPQDKMHKLFRNAGRSVSGAYWLVRKNKDTVFYTGIGLAAATELLTTGSVEPTKYVQMCSGREIIRGVTWLVTPNHESVAFTGTSMAVFSSLSSISNALHGSLSGMAVNAAAAALNTTLIGGPRNILPTYKRMWNWEKHKGKPPRGGKKRLAEWLQNARDTLGRVLPAPMPQPAYQPVNFMKTASTAPAPQVTMP